MSKRLPKRRTQTASATNRSELVDMLSNIEEKLLSLELLREDGGTQPRERLDEETCQEYVERMRLGEDAQRRERVLDPDGQAWPALTVFFDGSDYWLADGFHRANSARELGIASFQARIHQGTQRDAILHSLGVNATHGKRRTNADKRRAVERVMVDDEWSKFSDNKIAKLCKVSQPFVSKVRKELSTTGQIEDSGERIGQDGQVYDVEDMVDSRQKPARRKRASKRAAPSAEVLDAAWLEWDTIEHPEVDLVCAPALADESDWALLEQRVASVLSAEGAGVLAVKLPSRASFSWAKAAWLERALSRDFGVCTWSVFLDSGELVAIWSRQDLDLPATMSNFDELVASSRARRVLRVV